MTVSSAGSGPPPGRLRSTLEIIGLVATPTSLLVALSYYFGWARSQAAYGYFGVDQSALGFSTADYLLRSGSTVFLPLAVALLAAIGAFAVHVTVLWLLDGTSRASRRRVQLIVGLLTGVGGILFVCGIVGLMGHLTLVRSVLFNPFALGAGAILLSYATGFIFSRLLPSSGTALMTPQLTALRSGLMIGIVFVAAFWGISLYAEQEGIRSAKNIAAHPVSRPAAVVYSDMRLQISGHGVQVVPLDRHDAAYRYRYSGLRLLVHTPSRWILLPEGWTRTNGDTAILIADDSKVRVDFQPPSG